MNIVETYCEGSQCKKRDNCALHCVEPSDREFIDWSTYGSGHVWIDDTGFHVDTWCYCGDNGQYKKFMEVQV